MVKGDTLLSSSLCHTGGVLSGPQIQTEWLQPPQPTPTPAPCWGEHLQRRVSRRGHHPSQVPCRKRPTPWRRYGRELLVSACFLREAGVVFSVIQNTESSCMQSTHEDWSSNACYLFLSTGGSFSSAHFNIFFFFFLIVISGTFSPSSTEKIQQGVQNMSGKANVCRPFLSILIVLTWVAMI